ncbi:Multidrug resistance-associated protein 6 [Entomortierella lignicola]|nr:Multidrug resistance-associated protein 6 [Entomortierella lignicola]
MRWSVLCGLFMVVIITPIQGKAGQYFDTAQSAKSEAMDSRVRLMSQLLSNIKNVKMYGYEAAFKKKVDKYRVEEIRLLRKNGLVISFLSIIFTCLPLFMAFVSFAIYASFEGPDISRGEMNAQVIFVSLSLFGLLNKPIGVMSIVVKSTNSLRVACRRIQRFLLLEEYDVDAVQHNPVLPLDVNSPLIVIEDATFAWGMGSSKNEVESSSEEEDDDDETTALLSAKDIQASTPTLVDINLSFTRGSLNAILNGSVKVFGSIAYAPQQAWIINATVRDNTVFGKKFDQERYEQILFASGLLPDLGILAAGDQTEIGERGINLSGGQKQRVSLARAAYQDADIYLLDDPLSAVDAHVDQHLWENLLGPNGLLKDKTRILVTHGIHRLEQVDQILVIKDGKIIETGRFSHLMSAKNIFYNLIKEFSINHGSKKNHQQSNAVDDNNDTNTVIAGEDGPKNDEYDDEDAADGGLIEKEGVKASVVGWDTFKVYCKAM